MSKDQNSACVVGKMAPQFSWKTVEPDDSISSTSNTRYSGRWLVLLFYPRDFSFVCPTELSSFSAEKERFSQLNCDLLAASIDSLDSHRLWLKTSPADGGVEGLRFPLAADPDGTVCRAYGLWREHEGLPNRGVFLIDPRGILRYSCCHDLSVGRRVEDVIRVIEAVQSDGLCPANWKQASGVLDVHSMLKPGRVLGHYRIE